MQAVHTSHAWREEQERIGRSRTQRESDISKNNSLFLPLTHLAGATLAVSCQKKSVGKKRSGGAGSILIIDML